MINLIIDTNVYTKSPSRKDLDFLALEKLAKADKLKLYIPYIVEKEFLSQQRDKCKNSLDKTISTLTNISSSGVLDKTKNKMELVITQLKDNYNFFIEETQSSFIKWIKSIKAKRFPLTMKQTLSAWDAYFEGTPPLKEAKIRKDIPDSFIVRAIEQILHNNSYIYLVSEDKKITDCFSKNHAIGCFSSLSEFIKSEKIQDEIKNLDLIKEKIEQTIEAIKQNENIIRDIKDVIKTKLGEKLIDQIITDYTIPDDNHEATIHSYYDPESITLNVEELSYYGDGKLGFDFYATVRVGIYFTIYKANYYCMDTDNEHVPSVSELNDHFFDAEDECEIRVTGSVSLPIDYNDIDFDEIESNIEFEKIEIDEINQIDLIAW